MRMTKNQLLKREFEVKVEESAKRLNILINSADDNRVDMKIAIEDTYKSLDDI